MYDWITFTSTVKVSNGINIYFSVLSSVLGCARMDIKQIQSTHVLTDKEQM